MTTTKRTQGMNWISQTSRLAIYLRDGLACAYCGAGVEQAERLTLDHLKPFSKGGSNRATNLVTCCLRCNSARGNRPVARFVRAVAEYTDRDADKIAKHVRACAKRSLPRDEARAMIARRGSCAKAIAAI